MNKLTLGIGAAAAGLAVWLAVALTHDEEPTAGIILRAKKTDINDDQWGRIVAQVLKNPATIWPDADHREMLYRVREFAQGKPVGTPGPEYDDGKLPVEQLLEDRQEVINHLPRNFAGHAFQIGLGAIEGSQKIPKKFTDTSHAHGRPNISESEEMVNEVNDILKK